MKVQMLQFGRFLITRHDAERVVNETPTETTITFDFSGVEVANHCFVDELVKRLALNATLREVLFVNANDYTQRCIEAGLSTAISTTPPSY